MSAGLGGCSATTPAGLSQLAQRCPGSNLLFHAQPRPATPRAAHATPPRPLPPPPAPPCSGYASSHHGYINIPANGSAQQMAQRPQLLQAAAKPVMTRGFSSVYEV